MLLQNPFKRFASPTLNAVWVTVTSSFWDAGRNSRIGLAHRLPIAEIPRLQFLNRNAADRLPSPALGSRSCKQTCFSGRSFEFILELAAVVVVSVDHDNNSPVIWQPATVAARAIAKFAQQLLLSLEHAAVEGAVLRENPWKQSFQEVSINSSSIKNSKCCAAGTSFPLHFGSTDRRR